MITDWRFERYEPQNEQLWNDFVAASPNATFLFNRQYMDYHADRFADYSVMGYLRGKLAAVLPANADAETLFSHQGLTYGGWAFRQGHLSASDIAGIWQPFLAWTLAHGFSKIDYKPLPYIYALRPHEEDRYAILNLPNVETRCLLSSAADLREPVHFNTMMRRHLAAAQRDGFVVKETEDAERFMALVADCLSERYDAKPVHTAAEMALLKNRFPDQIRFFVVETQDKFHAGVCIYDTGLVAHCQYIASTPFGREKHLLPLLFHHLMTEIFAMRRYFDFGTSNEDGGRTLNHGLANQKWALGGGGVIYPRYLISLK